MKPVSWQDLRVKAARQPRRIILAEGEDRRVIQAAQALQTEKIAHPILIGSRQKIAQICQQLGSDSRSLECVDFQELSSAEKSDLAETWRSLPRNKQQTPEEALTRVADPLVLGSLYLKKGKVDGFVGGATRTTADTLKAIFNVIGLAPKTSTLFGFFFLQRRAEAGSGGMVLLADCAVMPEPSAKQLSNIAIGAADAYQFFLADQPKIAFLSFSTLGSASHPMVDKVREAVAMTREKAPNLAVEGEWQADTALDSFTAGIKGAGNSPMAGQANVLIVPDLNCGNIAYKLVQRIGQVRAVGPVLWGTAQPANDLSRGCSADDIVDMAALTALQAQKSQPVLS